MLVIYLFLLYLVLSTSFNIFLFLHFNGHMASSSRVLSLTFCWYSYLCISPFLYGYVLVFLFSFGTASVLVRLLPGCTNFCHYQCVNWQSTSPFFPKEKILVLCYYYIWWFVNINLQTENSQCYVSSYSIVSFPQHGHYVLFSTALLVQLY